MASFKQFHHDRLVLAPEPGSFTNEGESARWSNKDLDPVRPAQKKWEWYHVGGFWIAEGFSAAQMEVTSSAVALGMNPGIALVACLVGNLLVVNAVCVTGVSLIFSHSALKMLTRDNPVHRCQSER